MARIPSSSQKTMSPAEEVSPPNSAGTSLSPLSLLWRGFVPKASIPIGRSPRANPSLTPPLMMSPAHPLLTAIPAI